MVPVTDEEARDLAMSLMLVAAEYGIVEGGGSTAPYSIYRDAQDSITITDRDADVVVEAFVEGRYRTVFSYAPYAGVWETRYAPCVWERINTLALLAGATANVRRVKG